LIEFFNEIFKVPENSIINRKIPKKLFYENAELNKNEQKVIQEKIDFTYSLYKINQTKTKILKYENREYKYIEILIIYSKLKTDEKCDKIINILHKSFKNPVFLIIEYNEKFIFSLGHKRINQVDITKRVTEKIINTEWIQLNSKSDFKHVKLIKNLAFEKQNQKNLYELYSDYYNLMVNFNALNLKPDLNITDKQSAYKNEGILLEVKEKENEIEYLKKAIKRNKGLNFNEKFEINVKIKELEKSINNLKEKL